MIEIERKPSEWAAHYAAARNAILDSGDLEDMQSEVGQAAFQAICEVDNQLVDLIPDLLDEIKELQRLLKAKG